MPGLSDAQKMAIWDASFVKPPPRRLGVGSWIGTKFWTGGEYQFSRFDLNGHRCHGYQDGMVVL